MSFNLFKPLPLDVSTDINFLRRLVNLVNNILAGRLNVKGTFTLDASTITTTVLDNRCNEQSVIVFVPKTSNAAGVVASTYIATVTDGSFAVSHTILTSTDRTFDYVIIQ